MSNLPDRSWRGVWPQRTTRVNHHVLERGASEKAKPVPPMTAVAPGFWPKLLGRRLDLRSHGVETTTEGGQVLVEPLTRLVVAVRLCEQLPLPSEPPDELAADPADEEVKLAGLGLDDGAPMPPGVSSGARRAQAPVLRRVATPRRERDVLPGG
jgi:hypothetical protein